MKKEKYNLVNSLLEKKKVLTGEQKVSLVGQGDFPGANNIMRSAMNIKHHTQHLVITEPEFPLLYDGKENIMGEFSSFYKKADKDYKVINVIKKYNELLKGKCYVALYFLYSKSDDSYTLIERKEVENLTENYGFEYRNDFIDLCEVNDTIKKGQLLYASSSYDENLNTSIGVNARILYAPHPSVQDDAFIISESFAKRMCTDYISIKTIPLNENTILLNLYGDENNYKGLPNIGQFVQNEIIAATRMIKENRMFSDFRDNSLSTINLQSDQVFYGDGEIIDINVYCNNPQLKVNKVNKQVVQYYQDARWFYSEVYKECKKILNSGSKLIDKNINRWMKKAMNYLDTQAQWAFNDNVFSNLMIELTIRKRENIQIGRKLVGRHGNKGVTSSIYPDDEMPYITTDSYTDELGVVHPAGEKEPVEIITNPLAIINRTIPMALIESSVTFITDRIRKHLKAIKSDKDKIQLIIDVIKMFNDEEGAETERIYNSLSDYEKRKFIQSCINDGIFIRYEAFAESNFLRDRIIAIYKKYGDILKPYNVFMPKKKWGRDIYMGKGAIGFQYIMLLKQSGESGFSVRSTGAISDESLPEKSHENKVGKHWASDSPIRFGEYETPNLLVVANPEDFALFTALYRTSIDGRRYMYEAILSEDGQYQIPHKFTSRASQILEVYLKSLGVRMETIRDDKEYLLESEDDSEIVGYEINNEMIFCTPHDMYYLKKLIKIYKQYIKENPLVAIDVDDVWEYIQKNIKFDKSELTDNIVKLFKNNIDIFGK